MSSNQETMRRTVAAAAVTKVAAKATAVGATAMTVEVTKSSVGYVQGSPTGNATFVAAVAAAGKQQTADIQFAEMTKQATEWLAKDLLRSQGEIAF